MPRKGPVTKRDVLPDPVYGSKLLTRFINNMMLSTWFALKPAKIRWKYLMRL